MRRAGFAEGQSALVFGGGPIGAVTVQCLKAMGAGQIIVAEVAEPRKRKALEIGADAVIDPTEEDVVARVRELTGGEGADHSFDAAGIQATLQGALHATRKGGTRHDHLDLGGPGRAQPERHRAQRAERPSGRSVTRPQDFADTIAMLRDGSISTEGSSPSGSSCPTWCEAASTSSSTTRTAT